MRAIILGAGEGTRLRPLTADRPKCLVPLAGKPLLSRHLQLLRQQGVTDVTVVTGYRSELIDVLGVATRHNPDYDKTNMVATLMCAADLLDGSDDVLIAYADILYEPRILAALRSCPERISTAVDTSWLKLWQLRMQDPLADAETLKLDPVLNIRELGKRPSSLEEIEGQYMGLTKVRADFGPGLVRFYDQLDRDRCYDGQAFSGIYMTTFLQQLIDSGQPIRAVCVSGGWLEVDTLHDLALYDQLSSEGRLDEYCRIGWSDAEEAPRRARA